MAEIIPILHHKENFNEAVKKLSNLCKEDLHSTNTLILEKLDSSVPLIQEIGKYLILSGGKRLRPLLTTACYHILNNQSTNGTNHVGLAAAVEFIHAATLLHDDVVDLSKDRRGNLTANEVWGNKTSVLVGDFLFSRSFQLMTKYGTIETLKILSDTSVTISEGEVLEISNDKNLEMNEDTYFQVINGKTASLFSAACQVGGISGGAKDNEQQALKSFGSNFGMAFQLIDDAIDYSSNSTTMGKNIGDDFKEGKITLPLILAYGRSNMDEKKFLQNVISKPNENEKNFNRTKELLMKYKCIEHTLIRANHFADVAVDSLTIFKDNEYKNALIKLIETSIKRLS
ncbi:polyprenyl synthetase family protein [Pelagibacteraceae bacterium]|nr:polyprenyl synthetase family protein [Pelagibacteraceae bacterium]